MLEFEVSMSSRHLTQGFNMSFVSREWCPLEQKYYKTFSDLGTVVRARKGSRSRGSVLYMSPTPFCSQLFSGLLSLVGCTSCFCGGLHFDLTRSMLAAIAATAPGTFSTRFAARELRQGRSRLYRWTLRQWGEVCNAHQGTTGNTGSCSGSCCTVRLVQGCVTECKDVPVDSVEALMTALALPPVDPLDLTNSVIGNHLFGNPNNL